MKEQIEATFEQNYGRERHLQIKHLTTLKSWPKVWTKILKTSEEVQAALERVMIALYNSGPGSEPQIFQLVRRFPKMMWGIQTVAYWAQLWRQLRNTYRKGETPCTDHGRSKGRRKNKKKKKKKKIDKAEERISGNRNGERMLEVSVPDPKQGFALSAPVERSTHHGFVEHLKSYPCRNIN